MVQLDKLVHADADVRPRSCVCLRGCRVARRKVPRARGFTDTKVEAGMQVPRRQEMRSQEFRQGAHV